jgi:xeroderma pigmentosum group C-complementing protein
MPRNIVDFKNHPYYALERHLRHNEVLHPKQEAGRVNVGTSAVAKFETVYRRRDVHVVRSADKWFRLGRDVKVSGFCASYDKKAHAVNRQEKSH